MSDDAGDGVSRTCEYCVKMAFTYQNFGSKMKVTNLIVRSLL